MSGAKQAAVMAGVSARLDHIQLLSEAPERLAGFYRDAMGIMPERLDRDLWLCTAPVLLLRPDHYVAACIPPGDIGRAAEDVAALVGRTMEGRAERPAGRAVLTSPP